MRTQTKMGQIIHLATLYHLECYVLPAQIAACQPEYQPLLAQAHAFCRQCWADDWLMHMLPIQAMQTVPMHSLHTDTDTESTLARHHDPRISHRELVCLTLEDMMIGAFKVNRLNLNQLDVSTTPSEPAALVDIFQQLKQRGHTSLMLLPTLIVHPDWRKSKKGLGLSDMLVGLAIKYFLESPTTALLTVTCNDRGADDLVSRYGGLSLQHDVTYYGMRSDMMVLFKDTVCDSPVSGIPELLDVLWSKKIMAGDQSRDASMDL